MKKLATWIIVAILVLILIVAIWPLLKGIIIALLKFLGICIALICVALIF